jgi:hypothetical protein
VTHPVAAALRERPEGSRVAILSLRPAPASPSPARLERDMDVIRTGLEAGCAATHAALGG